MFTKALLAAAALGLVSFWLSRSRRHVERSHAGAATTTAEVSRSLESPNVAQRLQDSHALGVGAASEPEAHATWPASREFLRGA
jgi:hypothetical protein